MSYSKVERKIASILVGNPAFKNTIKWTYSWLNSIINKVHEKEMLHPDTTITDMASGIFGSTFWGYYDKPCTNGNGDSLFHQTDENPYKKNSGVTIYLKDIQGNIKKIATSKTWNWQQGAMLTWVSDSSFIFNDFDGEKYISHLYDISGKRLKTFDHPVYSVKNKKALSVNFSRLAKLRPDYGYFNLPYNRLEDKPEDEGIELLDLNNGEHKLIFSLKQLAGFKSQPTMESACHKANHIQFAPDGKYFNFLHRWYDGHKKYTRLLTANIDGTEINEIVADDMVSHCNWFDNDSIISWARKKEVGDHYFLFNTKVDTYSIIGEKILKEDGHPSILNGRWLLTDTYPDRSRMTHLILFDLNTNEKITLGRFYAPIRFWGVHRCDLHPRWNPDGVTITFDSVHTGMRRLYQLDLSKIIEKHEK